MHNVYMFQKAKQKKWTLLWLFRIFLKIIFENNITQAQDNKAVFSSWDIFLFILRKQHDIFLN